MRMEKEVEIDAEDEVKIEMSIHEWPLTPPPMIVADAADAENPELPFMDNSRDSSSPATAASPNDKSSSCCIYLYYFGVGFGIVLCIPPFILYLLYALVVYLVFGIDVLGDNGPVGKKDGRKKGIYQKVQEFQDAAVRLGKLISKIRNRVLVLVLLWLIINLSIAGLRNKNLLGSKLWKWSLLMVILSCGYHAISMIIYVCFYFLELICEGKKDVVYYIRGLRRSINMVIFSGSLLLIWYFYFRSDHGLKHTSGSDSLMDFATQTLISLLIFAVLWLLKRILLLKWEAHAVYQRFSVRILRAGFQLYFLAVISGTSWDIFRPVGEDRSEETQEEGDTNQNDIVVPGEGMIPERNRTENQRKTKESEENKKRAKDILHVGEHMLSKDVSTYAIQQMAAYFVALSAVSSREDDDITDILTKCREFIPPDHEHVTKDDLSDRLDEKERELLYAELQGKHHSQVSYAMFENWMMRAHKSCLALGYTLVDAKKVVYCLNSVLNCIVIAVFVLSWLLLTEIATTKVLVLIASPILAATFIFGNICKTMFEGIIFAFIKHPFDVGDRCVIDGTEMEIKHINILTTTFLRMGTKEEALYPNSVLAAEAIINLKGEPDPNDSVELSLDCATQKSAIDELEIKIKEYITGENGEKFEGSGQVMVKQIGNSIKIVVQFKHMVSILDVTHSQCNEKKNKQRSEFLLQIKQFLDDLKIKLATV